MTRRFPTWKESGKAWFELAGVWSLAIAWPIYQRVTSGPEALTGLGIRRWDLVVFIVVVSLLVPTILALIEVLVFRMTPERRWRVIHAFLLGSLVALFVWQQLDAAVLRVVLPLLTLGLFVVFYVRTELLRNFATMLAIATPVVIVLFALSYPVKQELLPGKSAMAAQETEVKAPVVIVLLDELPLVALKNSDDQVDSRFFPRIAELADTSTWYRGALSVADNTLQASPSIFTGQDPPTRNALQEPPPPGLAGYPDTVCSVAGKAGYEVFAQEMITDYCARSSGLGTRVSGLVEQGIPSETPAFLASVIPTDHSEDLSPGRIVERVIEMATGLFPQPPGDYSLDRDERIGEFAAEMPASERSISVLHVALPHAEYQYTPDGRKYGNRELSDIRTAQNQNVPENRIESTKNLQQLTSQLMYTDALLGRIVDRLKAEGTWEESLFVVTSDHGASFEVGSNRRVLDENDAGWLMPVPLFIKYPGQTEGKVVDKDVDSRDITPTVLDVLGLKASPEATGRSLIRDPLPPRKEATALSTAVGALTLPRRRIEAQEAGFSRLRNRAFGSGELSALGGHEELIGRPVPATGLEPVDYEPTSGSVYTDIDTTSDGLPVYFQADLPGLVADPGPLAITLNGKIVATARAWERDGTWMTGVNLPTDAFLDGKNETGVYAIGD